VKKENLGSSFDRWLREQGNYEETTSTAIKRGLARQVEQAMKDQNVSKAEMARAHALAPRSPGLSPGPEERCGYAQHPAESCDGRRPRNST